MTRTLSESNFISGHSTAIRSSIKIVIL